MDRSRQIEVSETELDRRTLPGQLARLDRGRQVDFPGGRFGSAPGALPERLYHCWQVGFLGQWRRRNRCSRRRWSRRWRQRWPNENGRRRQTSRRRRWSASGLLAHIGGLSVQGNRRCHAEHGCLVRLLRWNRSGARCRAGRTRCIGRRIDVKGRAALGAAHLESRGWDPALVHLVRRLTA